MEAFPHPSALRLSRTPRGLSRHSRPSHVLRSLSGIGCGQHGAGERWGPKERKWCGARSPRALLPHSKPRSPRGLGRGLEAVTENPGRDNFALVEAWAFVVFPWDMYTKPLPNQNPAARDSHPANASPPLPSRRLGQPRSRPIKSGNETIHQLALSAS